ncbi:hypothetical protein LP421_06280 [Rhizobium sp. RCAM05350]|nr:hypothetical protein LP421_06280 [Rhizobium sp. RCAM05350]
MTKTILITGTSSGYGKAIAELFGARLERRRHHAAAGRQPIRYGFGSPAGAAAGCDQCGNDR